MEPDFWHRRWNNNEIGFHQQQVNLYLRELWPMLGAPRGGAVFVPLCGKSRDMLWLNEHGHPVVGNELSRIAVEAFFLESGLHAEKSESGPFVEYRSGTLQVLLGDFFDLTSAHLEEVRGIYDRASLIAFPPDMRPRYVRHLTTLLPAEARMLLITLEYPENEMQGPPFSVREDEVRHLFGASMTIHKVREADALAQNQRFARNGVSALTEKVYRLVRR